MKRWPDAVALTSAVAAACVCTACASMGDLLGPTPDGRGAVHAPSGQPLAPQAALDSITPGKSSKGEVFAALGQAIAISFDSGNEVWVYRWPGADRTPRAATELVVLFDARGLATKARIRPGLASID